MLVGREREGVRGKVDRGESQGRGQAGGGGGGGGGHYHEAG